MRYLKIALSVLLLLCFVLFPGGQKEIAPAPVTKAPAEEAEEEWYEYDLSEYMTMGDITAVQAEFDDPTVCTDKEVDAAVFQMLLSQADFIEKKGKAERYNKVTVDFSILQNGETLSRYSQSDYDIVIGLETQNAVETVLGEALMGAAAGEVRTTDYTYPEEVAGNELAGQSVVLSAVVKKVHQQIIPELIDATVVEMFEGEFQTVSEFRESVREDILEEKEMAKAQAVWLAILKDVKIRYYPERELADYIALYTLNYENLAEKFEMSLESLVTVYLEQDMEAFQAEAKAYAEEKVKNDMIFTQLVRLQNITLTEEEYEAGLMEYFENEESEFASLEEFVAYYTEENLRQNILWDKALKAVVDRAVRIGG